ncbi:hypothetical protein DFJ73DRAFT_962429 [Zopfochytrium polystomum]|nr:hypothetical protein DFJ73DRAFT_962429 [Zopfochytrium polystomum]
MQPSSLTLPALQAPQSAPPPPPPPPAFQQLQQQQLQKAPEGGEDPTTEGDDEDARSVVVRLLRALVRPRPPHLSPHLQHPLLAAARLLQQQQQPQQSQRQDFVAVDIAASPAGLLQTEAAVLACAVDLRQLLINLLTDGPAPPKKPQPPPATVSTSSSAVKAVNGVANAAGSQADPPSDTSPAPVDPFLADGGGSPSGAEATQPPEDLPTSQDDAPQRRSPSILEIAILRYNIAVCFYYVGRDRDALETLHPAISPPSLDTVDLSIAVRLCILYAEIGCSLEDSSLADYAIQSLDATQGTRTVWKRRLALRFPAQSAVIRDQFLPHEKALILLIRARSLLLQKKPTPARSFLTAAFEFIAQANQDPGREADAQHLARVWASLQGQLQLAVSGDALRSRLSTLFFLADHIQDMRAASRFQKSLLSCDVKALQNDIGALSIDAGKPAVAAGFFSRGLESGVLSVIPHGSAPLDAQRFLSELALAAVLRRSSAVAKWNILLTHQLIKNLYPSATGDEQQPKQDPIPPVRVVKCGRYRILVSCRSRRRSQLDIAGLPDTNNSPDSLTKMSHASLCRILLVKLTDAFHCLNNCHWAKLGDVLLSCEELFRANDITDCQEPGCSADIHRYLLQLGKVFRIYHNAWIAIEKPAAIAEAKITGQDSEYALSLAYARLPFTRGFTLSSSSSEDLRRYRQELLQMVAPPSMTDPSRLKYFADHVEMLAGRMAVYYPGIARAGGGMSKLDGAAA